MVDSTDILIKAAEDVTGGMWCKGAMFKQDPANHEAPGWTETWSPELGLESNLDKALSMKRCAVGSLAIATVQLGGSHSDYIAACARVAHWIEYEPDRGWAVVNADEFPEGLVAWFNDTILPDDPFEAGSRLSDLFRSAAATV